MKYSKFYFALDFFIYVLYIQKSKDPLTDPLFWFWFIFQVWIVIRMIFNNHFIFYRCILYLSIIIHLHTVIKYSKSNMNYFLNISIWPIVGTLTRTSLWVRVDLRVITMKGYSTLWNCIFEHNKLLFLSPDESKM